MIVLDASALVEFLLDTPVGRVVAARLLEGGDDLHAPQLLDLEVCQALRRLEAARLLDAERAEGALADMADMPLRRYGHSELLPRLWQLRRNVTAYDGAYLALAEALDAVLLTCDARLARVPSHEARVELIRA